MSPGRRMLAGGSVWPIAPPPGAPWPAAYVSLAHNNDYAGGGSFDNYIHAFTSADGITWAKIGSHDQAGSILPGTALRDPDIMYWHGRWWCLCQATVLASDDFGTGWALVGSIPTGVLTWASTWYVGADDVVHAILTLQYPGNPFRMYEVHALDEELTSWSSPVQITGTGFPTNSIDPHITLWDDVYYLLYKDEDQWRINLATSAAPFSGYTTVQSGNWAGWATGGGSIEGPKVVDLGDRWRIYFTQNSGFDAAAVHYSETMDRTMMSGWSARTAMPTFNGYNHPMPIRQP